MSTFVGGKLKLKGGVDPSQLKGGVKKKKKKAAADALAVVPADGEPAAGGAGGDQQAQTGVVKATKEGVVLDPSAVADRRTEAEKKAEEHFLKHEAQRAKKIASKSHRERIKELNEKLASLTEHNDLFNKYIESIEFSDQFHAVFQYGEQPRQGLTAQQKQQGLVAFCRYLLATLQMPACSLVVNNPTFEAMVAVVKDMTREHMREGEPLGPLGLLAWLADTALFCVGGDETEEGTREQHASCVHQADMMIAHWPGVQPAAAWLEELQQRLGYQPQLSAVQQHSLAFLLKVASSRALAFSHLKDGNEQQAQQHFAAASQACAELVALHPEDAGLKLLLGSIATRMHQSAQLTAVSLRAAFEAADASTEHWTASIAGLCLAQSLAGGMEGSTCSVAEVQHLLGRAKHHDQLCKAWLPDPLSSRRERNIFRAHFADQVVKLGGPGTIPATFVLDPTRSSHLENLKKQRCSHCDKKAYQLKRCSACKQAAYCSVECQRLAWKGGHRRECAKLAARRG
ncbi:Conserved alpha-helical (ISS) [Chlorella sorokiniana]|uniref:Conserved alpha-helical (ISS) n=1 Tax=Chlorella sorokiniana TaxID=3076 RepID=A0A2P6TPK4_CHLSO|nr:Conserved alpha-helical (ISS) [Chlorella sorokiniana]|eukprot:PRW55967.1 Conserved alpha-helical (ISS) [Chlorella sorokiniana]